VFVQSLLFIGDWKVLFHRIDKYLFSGSV
jgi:hypothetical protein